MADSLIPSELHYVLTEDGLSIGPKDKAPEGGVDISKCTSALTVNFDPGNFVTAHITVYVHAVELERIQALCTIVDPSKAADPPKQACEHKHYSYSSADRKLFCNDCGAEIAP